MKPMFRTLTLVSATAVATAAATTVLPIGAGQSSTPAIVAATAAQAIEAPLVTGLPDFTQLVERVGPAVVNIEATGSQSRNPMVRGMPMPDDGDVPEFFRRYFGPDAPFPGGPGGPPRPDAASGPRPAPLPGPPAGDSHHRRGAPARWNRPRP